VLELSRVVFYREGSKDESKARTPEKEQPAEAVPSAAPSRTTHAATVAAITAAVAAYTGKSDVVTARCQIHAQVNFDYIRPDLKRKDKIQPMKKYIVTVNGVKL
jgi:coenzyme F420-reducing hydrogenase beta subunit